MIISHREVSHLWKFKHLSGPLVNCFFKWSDKCIKLCTNSTNDKIADDVKIY